ncbi:peptide ABC transporter substrate-binding protein [Brevibacillus sp. NRS-1366]|uniref:peptide ABC transporter substrate-binding protein n=1 Tax=Brevibacillus sp. NRS-1366 TaxID=3233899 RepID=UPI003D1F7BD8
MKKYAFSIASIFLAASMMMAGCTGSSVQQGQAETTSDQGTEQAAKGGKQVLRLNFHTEPPTADPGIADDNTSSVVLRATFDGLTRLDPDGKQSPSVAETIDVSPDLKTYTFHLRDSKWSNGDPVTAHDFEFAWKRVLNPETASTMAYEMYVIKGAEAYNKGNGKAEDVGIKATDDKTLVVEMENPSPYFLELTSLYTFYPLNKKAVEANKNWATEAATHIGNGAFKMDVWQHKSKMTLSKNGEYWDKDKVQIDRIEFSMVEDESTELSMFENDDLDWVGSPMSQLPVDAIGPLKESGRLQIQPIAATYMLKFNTNQAPFQNAKIRKAFAYAINRQTIVDNVLQANQEPATGIVPGVMPLNRDGYFKDNDAENAKKLLDEGMKELGITELPKITFSLNSSQTNKTIAEAMQDQWKKVLGVDVKLELQEWKVYLDTMRYGKYQLGRMTWSATYKDPVTFLNIFKDKTGENNETGWENPRFKELIEASGKEADNDKRLGMLAEAEQILMDEMPIAPVYFNAHSWMTNPKVKGALPDGLGNIDFKWATIE